jgi:hypothetical protein
MPPQTRNKILEQIIVVLLFVLIACMILFFLRGFAPRNSSHDISFQVEASGGYALVSLKTPQSSILPAKIVTVPWHMEMTLPQGAEVYLTAANPSQTGELSCTISLDDQSWKTEKKVAPQDGVACAGIVP